MINKFSPFIYAKICVFTNNHQNKTLLKAHLSGDYNMK